MKTVLMSPGLFEQYVADPLEADAKVRRQCGVPKDRYYVVCTWPPERAGRLTVDMTRTRAVHAHRNPGGVPFGSSYVRT